MPQTERLARTPHLSEVDAGSHLLATVLTSIPDYVYAFNRQRRFAFANAAMLKLFGLSSEEMLGKTFADLGYPNELADRLNSHIDRVLRDGITIEDEVFFRAPTGHAAYFWFLWSPVHSADGAVELVVGLSRETTQRRAMEEELRRSEAQFRSFADNSSNLIWIGDTAEARIIFRSAAFERIWGTPSTNSPASMTEWLLTVHSEDRDRVQHALDVVKGGEVAQFDYRIIRPVDGKIRYLRDTSFPIFDEFGAVSRIGGITEDLSHKDSDQVYIVSAKPDEARRLSILLRGVGRLARSFADATVFLDLATVLMPGYVLVDLRCKREEG